MPLPSFSGSTDLTGVVKYATTGTFTAKQTFSAISTIALETQQVAANVSLRNLLLSGDANAAFRILGDGKHEWGAGGASAVDTQLYRSGAAALRTDSSFFISSGKHLETDQIQSYGTGNVLMNSDTKLSSGAFFHWGAAANVQTTVGAAGGASAPPATPTKYLKVKDDGGTTLVIPAYAAS